MDTFARTFDADTQLRGLIVVAMLLRVTSFRFGTNLAQDFRHFLVDPAVGCEDLRTRQIEWSSIHIGDGAAGLLDQQRARRDVPRLQPEFPEAIEPAACDRRRNRARRAAPRGVAPMP